LILGLSLQDLIGKAVADLLFGGSDLKLAAYNSGQQLFQINARVAHHAIVRLYLQSIRHPWHCAGPH
jgi:hypothetical protein